MKKLALVVVVTAVVALAGAAMAADTASVSVSATVAGVCKFQAGAKTVTFTLDPSVGGNVSGVVSQPTFWCTKGASYTITDDKGLNGGGTTYKMKHATLTDTIPYTFTYTAAGTGTGASAPITMNIAGQVLAADYLNVSAGSYGDTVTLSINP